MKKRLSSQTWPIASPELVQNAAAICDESWRKSDTDGLVLEAYDPRTHTAIVSGQPIKVWIIFTGRRDERLSAEHLAGAVLEAVDRSRIAAPSKPRAARRTGLYRHYDADGRLLYIGVSRSAAQRLAQHKASRWDWRIAKVTVQYYSSRDEALAAERQAIKAEDPRFNIAHNRRK